MDFFNPFSFALLWMIASLASASISLQDTLEVTIERVAEFVEDDFMPISYINVVDNHEQLPPKMITDILQRLEGPKYVFNREEVTTEVRDHIYMHASGGIAIWWLPEKPAGNQTELKDQIWSLDQNVSGFKKCITIIIDDFGRFREIFDQDQRRYQAPEKLHCPTVLIRNVR